MWRYYLQKVLYSVKAGRLFLFLCDYVHINIYINSLKLTNVTVGTDHLIRNITSVWKQDPGIQELEEDGSQRDGGAALQGRGSGICGHVGQLCG